MKIIKEVPKGTSYMKPFGTVTYRAISGRCGACIRAPSLECPVVDWGRIHIIRMNSIHPNVAQLNWVACA